MTATEAVFAVGKSVEQQRFELHRDGEVVGLATYQQNGFDVVVPHVETYPEHRGQGYAARLMDGTLDLLRASGRTVMPLCPFAAQHLRDSPQHHDLLA